MPDRLAIQGGPPAVPTLHCRRWPFWSAAVERPILERIRAGDLDAMRVDPLISELESGFVESCSPGSFAVFCASGTAALFSAYFAVGLDSGAEVLVPTNTFRATVTPLLLLNLRPVLCDSDPETGAISLTDAAARVTARTQALVVTHLWGHPADMDAAVELAERYGLALVEDCSHAHGARWRGRPVGTFGAAAAFSLGTTKMISGGTAGMLVTRRREVYERALVFGQPKHRALAQVQDPVLREYSGTGLGANLRGTPLAAALALDHLKRLPQTISTKNENLGLLARLLQEATPRLRPPARQEGFTHGAWYTFNARWDDPEVPRDLALRALQAEGVLVDAPRAALHRHRLFGDASPLTSYTIKTPLCRPEEYPQTDRLLARVMTFGTREFYEPATEIVNGYSRATAKLEARIGDLRRAAGPAPGVGAG